MGSLQVIQRRLEGAGKEIENYPNYDYILVNDRLEQSIDKLQAVITAERLRRAGVSPSPETAAMFKKAEESRLPNVREHAKEILASFAAPVMPGGNRG